MAFAKPALSALAPRSEWTLPRKLAWFAAYAAICYWSWFLVIPHT